LVERPYSEVVSWLRGRVEDAGVAEPDLDALALIMIEPMSAYRSLQQLFDRVPGEVDDERFIDTWVEVCLAYARSAGLS
jgi:hypothetical protein